MRVVHCKREPYTHYIGRTGHGFVSTGLGNPSVMSTEADRPLCIADFETYARATPRVMTLIASLPEDAVLGCWCAPKACHGDVIIKLWKELHAVR